MAQPKSAQGVRDLISRIRDDGVQAGKSEADRILQEARAEAARVLAEAKSEADALRTRTREELEAHRASSLEALRLAARDTVLDLQAGIARDLERHIQRLVSSATRDEELIKNLVLVLAGRVASDIIGDKRAVIQLSETLFEAKEASAELEERERDLIRALTNEMLREGIELAPAKDVHGGARVRLVGENLEIDLTDQTISHLLYDRMLPRFRDIVRGND